MLFGCLFLCYTVRAMKNYWSLLAIYTERDGQNHPVGRQFYPEIVIARDYNKRELKRMPQDNYSDGDELTRWRRLGTQNKQNWEHAALRCSAGVGKSTSILIGCLRFWKAIIFLYNTPWCRNRKLLPSFCITEGLGLLYIFVQHVRHEIMYDINITFKIQPIIYPDIHVLFDTFSIGHGMGPCPSSVFGIRWDLVRRLFSESVLKRNTFLWCFFTIFLLFG